MKFKKCAARLFFRNPKPHGSYGLNEILDELETNGRDAYDVLRKSAFCVDLKNGCPRGLGKVISLNRQKNGF